MKSMVFTLKRKFRFPRIRRENFSVKEYFARYGLQIFFMLTFLLGLILGVAYATKADKDFLLRLDFLFLSNMNSRLSMSAFEIFCSCFTTDFLVLFVVFCFSFAPWGTVTLPFCTAFKGFSVGVSSAFIFSLYRMSGIGFYILVVLPGAILFLFALVSYCKEGFTLSVRFLRLSLFGSIKEPYLNRNIRSFFNKSLIALLVTLGSSLLDMILWVLFAHMFNFS